MAKLLIVLALALCAHTTLAQNFSLPTLPYGFDAMAPAIDNFTHNVHWTRGVQTFVNNLNNALAACPDLQGEELTTLVSYVGNTNEIPSNCQTGVRNAGGGLLNHVLFYLHYLAPYGEQTYEADASPELKAAINEAFGNYTNFKTSFAANATSVFGSGWAWLVADPETKALNITTTPNQDNPLMELASVAVKGVPILGLDVWEHAYFINYQTGRPLYIGNFTDYVANWQGASDIYAAVVNDSPIDPFIPASNYAVAPAPGA